MEKEAVPYNWLVTYGVHSATVTAVDRGQATQKAAALWGLEWRAIVAYCQSEQGRKAEKPRCRLCSKRYGGPGDESGHCPDCRRRKEQYRRDMAQLREPDRRARYGR